MRLRPTLLAILASLAMSTARADEPIPWGDPAFQKLEMLQAQPLRSPWDDLRDRLDVPPKLWREKDEAQRLDLLRRAFGLYVDQLSNLERSGAEDRAVFDTVTAEQVLKIKDALGQESANSFAKVRSKLIARRFEEKGELISEGLEWLDKFSPAEGTRLRQKIAAKKLGTADEFGRAAEGSRERSDIPSVSVTGGGFADPRSKRTVVQEEFVGERPQPKVLRKTFADAPPDVRIKKSEQKSLWEIDRDRRNGMASMALGGMVAGVGAFVCTINPWVGGAMIVGGAALAIHGYNKYQENTLTDAQTRELESQQARNRKKFGL